MEVAFIIAIILRMEVFFLCWMLDKRWLFGLPNPCSEFTLLIPAVINLATLITILLERAHVNIEVESSFILLLTLYIFLALLSIILLIRTYRRAEEKMGQVKENADAIRNLRHSFQLKKGVWSWVGLCLTVLSAVQLGVNRHYIGVSTQAYGCIANYTRLLLALFRMYLDAVGWGWIGIMFAIFLACKLGFLFCAWKHPEKYLRYKEVI